MNRGSLKGILCFTQEQYSSMKYGRDGCSMKQLFLFKFLIGDTYVSRNFSKKYFFTGGGIYMRVKTENMIQKSDGTMIYEPRTIQEVFNDIKKILIAEGLCPDEYFSLSYPMRYVDEAFPEISGLLCNAQWGGSEGIYLDIAMDVFISEEKIYKQISFITGKTLCESEEAFDRMQYIGGYVYRLLMGDGNVHARYILSSTPKQNKDTLDRKLNYELKNLMKKTLYSQKEDSVIDPEELALKATILKVVTAKPLTEDKLKQLLEADNALDTLYNLCRPVMPATLYEVEDIISSARTLH